MLWKTILWMVNSMDAGRANFQKRLLFKLFLMILFVLDMPQKDILHQVRTVVQLLWSTSIIGNL